MATVSTNISAAAPYFDDYNTSGNEDKNYLRVLFKPGVPIQTRELNQLQTALQNQIAKLGSHVFPDNSRVLDGELFVDRGLPSIDVDMASGYRTSAQITSSVIGQTIENSGDTVTAKVIDARNISGNTWKLFLRYTKTTDSETISSDIVFTAPTYESTFETSAAIDIGGANIGTVVSVGLAARYKINPGVYFTKGSFVKVEEQIVYLDTGSTNLEYAAQPILRVVESVANSNSDPSLRDNASGSTNIGAPGADRYKIDLQLKVLTDNPTILGIASNTDALSLQDFSSDAIKLADVQNGNVIEPNDYVYNELGEVLAKRTFEESGNYVVNPFKLDMREHLNTGASRTERGKFTSAQGGDSSLIAIDIEPSVAYVQGKRRETINKRTVELRKARDTFSGIYGEGSTISGYETVAVQVNKGNYVEAANVFGVPDSSATCELYAATSAADSPTADETTAGTLTSGHIGTCKVSSVHFTGTTYKVYISDIAMDAGFELSDVNYILEETASTGSIGPSGRADDFTFAASTGDKESGFVLKDVENTQDIFPFGRDTINDVKNLRYGVRSVTSSISLGGAVTSVFLTAGSNGVASDHRFYSTNPNDYIIVKDDGSVHPTGSTAIALSNPDANGEFQQALITFASLDDTIQVMYSARKLATLANGKKTLQTDSVTPTVTSLTKNEEFTLSQVDVQSIVSVVHASDASVSAADFKLISGRTPTSYGTSKVRYAGVNKTGLSGTMTITFLRFNHATTSEPFTVESYNINGFNNTNVSGTSSDYEDIYKEDTISNIDRVTDGIDFRATTVTIDPNSIITADINYFLPRHDRLFIDKNGDFVVAEGKSNLDPRPPALPKEALLLYDLLLPAYTFTPRDIDLISAQNKRYTMKDIGTIDERLKAVEYHTALSLLEKDAEGRQIFDNDGLRFNNGILVDNFSGHGIGNPSDLGYACAVDSLRQFLRPSYSAKNVGLYMGGPAGRTPADNISTVGTPQPEPSLRLPATEKKVLLEQPYASTAISVNPFELAAYFGDITLTPSSDEWKSIDRRPDVNVTINDNLDTITNLFEEAGVIGTFWNEWETNWSGWDKTAVSATYREHGTHGRLARDETFVRTGTGTRDGLARTAQFNEIETDLGDRVVDVSFIPFIRSRRVYFQGVGFKPNTRLIPYFDGVNIDIYTRSATLSDFEANTYADVSDRASFEMEVNDSPAGMMSSAVGGTPGLTTDSTGTIFGFFVIPNNDKIRFKTGDRVFKLIDSTEVDDPNASTFGEVVYTAKGLTQSVERSIISTRQLQVDTTRLSQRQDFTQTKVNTVYWDPLAQSFLIGEYNKGVYISDIDLYFRDVDTELPVSIRLVKVENGIPTQKIIPGSKVSKTAAEMSGQGSQTASIATNFRFEQPIYLAYGQEYAIVVLSNSPNYMMWHSTVGGTDVSTGVRITKNPYAGVSFVSQNASTWTPNQDTDYKMKINYLEFSDTLSTTYELNAILPQNSEGTSQHTNAATALNATGMVLLAEDTRPVGTDIKYTLTLGDGKIYNMEPGKLTYFDNAIPASGSTVGGYNISSAGQINISAQLSSTDKHLTPMVDLDRLSVLTVSNIVNNDNTNETLKEHGDATARYITRTVKLKNASTALDVYLGINRPEGTDVEVYALFNNFSNIPPQVSESAYVKLDHAPIPFNTNRNTFPEVNFRKNFSDVVNASGNTSAIEEFTEFTVKIVMLSNQSQRVPTLKELRCVATV